MSFSSGVFVIHGLSVGSHDVVVALSSRQLLGVRSVLSVDVVPGMAEAGAPTLSEDDDLDVEEIDFHIPNNRLAHRTEEYDDDTELIVRRGQPVRCSLRLSHDIKKANLTVSAREVIGSFSAFDPFKMKLTFFFFPF